MAGWGTPNRPKYAPPPDPDRSVFVTLKQSELLRMVDKALAAGVSTHEWAREALIAACR